MELTIYAKKIVRAMIIAVLIITLVSFAARVAKQTDSSGYQSTPTSLYP